MDKSLTSSLLLRNIALLRENQHLMDYILTVELCLAEMEKHGKESGIVQLDKISAIRRQIGEIRKAEHGRRVREVGRTDKPSQEELAKIAKIDGNTTIHYCIIDDAIAKDILDKMIADMFSMPKDIDQDDPNGYIGWAEYKKKNPKKGKEWHKNFGGDLEGEWEDTDRDDNDDPPRNPLDRV
jgi:hypothetical protein